MMIPMKHCFHRTCLGPKSRQQTIGWIGTEFFLQNTYLVHYIFSVFEATTLSTKTFHP